MVKIEHERLEKENVTEQVETSSWSIYLVTKPNESIRLCADFKTSVIIFWEDNHHLPWAVKFFAALQGGKLFNKIDFVNTYNLIGIKWKNTKTSSVDYTHS